MSDRKWVVLELSHHGEKKTPNELLSLVQEEVGDDVEVFIPSVTFSRRDSTMTICLMEGYFFIEAAMPPSSYYALEELAYIQRVLTQDDAGSRYLYYVDDATINDLKSKLQKQAARDIKVGDYVRVCEGAYSELTGKILEVFSDRKRASVHVVDLQSMKVIVELPFQFFEPIDEEDDEYYQD